MNLQRSQSASTTVACILLLAKSAWADWDGPGNEPPFGGNADAGDHCGWWGGNCDGNGSYGNSSGSSSSQLGFTASELSHYNKIITVHAALACLVWVFLIPVGGILMRAGLKSPWVLRVHALLQSTSFLIYLVAVGCGIYLVRTLSFGQYDMWQDPHIKLGLAILVLAFLQPILGLIHHVVYKRRAAAAKAGASTKQPGRTAPGHTHVWLGRALIFLGMINGGLGLRLAGSSPYETNKQAKVIAYSVGAAVMFLLYVSIVVIGERRRTDERRNQVRSAVPVVAPGQAASVGYTYHHPPSYEASQETLVKESRTTARYS